MKCFTVLLACGWLLLFPPGKQTTKKWGDPKVSLKDLYDYSAPLSKWEHKASFDTAKDCEVYKSEDSERTHDAQAKAEAEGNTRGASNLLGYFVLTLTARCVPSDMLKGN